MPQRTSVKRHTIGLKQDIFYACRTHKKLDFNLVILLAFSHIFPFVHKNEANCLQLKLMFITGVLSCLPPRKA